ncbi:MAG TPA: DUF1217 domain-containing protein [Stellaceae bacterium]|nr:DUF1217 domain-containing protein [Stellaceae bacterium]
MSGVTGLSLYTLTEKTETAQLASFAKTPTVKQATAAFSAAAPTITTVDELLNNYKALSVALGSVGLSGVINQRALLKEVLTQDPKASKSYVNQVSDARFRQFATNFGSLSTDGGAKLKNASFIQNVNSNYVQNQFEKSIGKQDTYVQQSMYFTRLASGATGKDAMNSILADATLGAVVRGAYSLPSSVGGFDPSVQKTMLTAQGFDVTKLQDPAYVKNIAERYLLVNDQSASSSSSSLLSLFNGSTSSGNSILSTVEANTGGTSTGTSSSSNASLINLFA